MSTFYENFHHQWAHLYPAFFDLFAEAMLNYNIRPKTYGIETDNRTYTGINQMFQTNLDEHIETYNLIKEAIDIAVVNGDKNMDATLKELLRKWGEFMNQAYVLRDKAMSYGDINTFLFDAHSKEFYMLQNMYDELIGG